MRERTNVDASVLYVETKEEEVVRLEAEEEAKSRGSTLGIHRAFTTKAQKADWGVTKGVKVGRVSKKKIDINSKLWKDYISKKISFKDMISKVG